jgi:hypothetical protein
MGKLTNFALSLLTAAGLTLAGSPAASASEVCHDIDATASGWLTGATPFGFATASQLQGGGLLQGTTTADVRLTGYDPDTGIATYGGTFVITAPTGTLTLEMHSGLFDMVHGLFSNDSFVTEGTGMFEGWTGDIYFEGYVLADGIHFEDNEVSGRICGEHAAE